MALTKTRDVCSQNTLRIGARVVCDELDAVRVVVGHTADGRCMTVYETPLPWMDRRVYLEDEFDLRRVAGPPQRSLLGVAV